MSNTQYNRSDFVTQHNAGFTSFHDIDDGSNDVRTSVQGKVGYIIDPDTLDERKNGTIRLFH